MTSGPQDDAGGDVAGSAAVTAASQIAAMTLGGLLAVLVLAKFGTGPQSDGFFAAYGVYAVLIAVAQSLRVTVVAPLARAPSLFAAFDRHLAAILLLFAAAAVPLVALGDQVAAVLTGDLGPEARETATTTLALLWLGAGGQLVAALAAAALGVRREFGVAAIAFLVGSAFPVVFLLVFAGAMGIEAAAAGNAIGGALAALLAGGRLWRVGWRPGRGLLDRAAPRVLWTILLASVAYVVLQVQYVVSLAYAARLGVGEVTVYTYSFFAALVLIGASSGPAGIVMAGPVSRGWDGDPRSLTPHLVAVVRAGLVVILPPFGLAAVVGVDVIELVLGDALSAGQRTTLVVTFLALSGMAVGSIASQIPIVAAFARGRYRAVGLIAVVGVAAHVVLTALALELDALPAIGAAASLSGLLVFALLLVDVYRGAALRPAALVLRETVLLGGAAAVAFVPCALLAAQTDSIAADAALAVAGCAVFLAIVRVALAEQWGVLLRVAGAIAPGRRISAPPAPPPAG